MGDNETAFEPDLLVLMQRIEEINGKDVEVFRQATIMKDRSNFWSTARCSRGPRSKTLSRSTAISARVPRSAGR